MCLDEVSHVPWPVLVCGWPIYPAFPLHYTALRWVQPEVYLVNDQALIIHLVHTSGCIHLQHTSSRRTPQVACTVTYLKLHPPTTRKTVAHSRQHAP